ncbi:MAG: hypothetical protein KAI83_11755 [Thiomargarita sp.]|nr:hypothetical protein [Thiomargarita sp.]
MYISKDKSNCTQKPLKFSNYLAVSLEINFKAKSIRGLSFSLLLRATTRDCPYIIGNHKGLPDEYFRQSK